MTKQEATKAARELAKRLNDASPGRCWKAKAECVFDSWVASASMLRGRVSVYHSSHSAGKYVCVVGVPDMEGSGQYEWWTSGEYKSPVAAARAAIRRVDDLWMRVSRWRYALVYTATGGSLHS